jgi:hypothetical protein
MIDPIYESKVDFEQEIETFQILINQVMTSWDFFGSHCMLVD